MLFLSFSKKLCSKRFWKKMVASWSDWCLWFFIFIHFRILVWINLRFLEISGVIIRSVRASLVDAQIRELPSLYGRVCSYGKTCDIYMFCHNFKLNEPMLLVHSKQFPSPTCCWYSYLQKPQEVFFKKKCY